MNAKLACGACAALMILAASAAPAQPVPLTVGAPEAPSGPMLKQGTEIRMVTLTELTSKRNRVGDRIDLEVQEAVTLGGQTVIAAGTRGVGEVTLLKKKGMWGKSGKLEFRPLYLKIGDRQIRVSGNPTRDKGKAGTAGVVAAVAFLPLAGFLVTGTSAVIPPQTPFSAYLDEDLPVVFAGQPAAPAPLVVPAAAKVEAITGAPAAAPAATPPEAAQPE